MPKGDPKGGRPPIELTEAQAIELEALAAYLSQDMIADYFGISRPTLAAIMKRNPDVLLRYKRGKAKVVGIVAQSLIQKARGGDNTAAIFYLKTQAGWKETSVVDNTSSDGSMSPVQMTDEQVSKELEKRGLPKAILDE